MALRIEGPGDVRGVDATGFAPSGGGSGAHAPTWSVGDPVAVAMAGLQKASERFADTYDDVQVNDYLMKKAKEMDERYNNPETGLFATRKRGAAQGLYQEEKDYFAKVWDEDAPKYLSERQLRMASKPFGALFRNAAHNVASFETSELMSHQVDTAENSIFAAQNLVASGATDANTLGAAMNSINIATQNLGRMQGWDAETTERKKQEYIGDMLIKGAIGLSATRPEMAVGMLKTYKDEIPPIMYGAALKTLQSHAEASAKKAEAAKVKTEFDSFYNTIKDAPTERQIAEAEKKYGKNPKMLAEALDMLAFREGAKKNIENKKGVLRMNEIEGRLTEALSRPPDQQLAATEDILTSLPLDLRPKARKMLASLSAETSGDNGPSNPAALREATNRLANGEEFNIRAEYGEHLAPADLSKLMKGQKEGLQKKIKPMFIMELNRWKGGNAKTYEDMYGKNSSAATMFSSFMQSLPDEVAEDPRRLKEAMSDFFKTEKLNSGAALWGGDRNVPRGMAADFMDTYEAPYPVIKRGSDLYGMADAALKARKVPPAGMNGQYSDKQITEAMRELITQRPSLRGRAGQEDME